VVLEVRDDHFGDRHRAPAGVGLRWSEDVGAVGELLVLLDDVVGIELAVGPRAIRCGRRVDSPGPFAVRGLRQGADPRFHPRFSPTQAGIKDHHSDIRAHETAGHGFD
jgi:hypothetical protein